LIVHKAGSLFESDAPVLVHGVNCVGTMGAGIARQFASRYPDMLLAYRRYCQEGHLSPGGLFIWSTPDAPIIVNAATQQFYGSRGRAKMEWLQESLEKLVGYAPLWDAVPEKRMAMPRIGSGLGGLDWFAVEPIIKIITEGFEVEVWTPQS